VDMADGGRGQSLSEGWRRVGSTGVTQEDRHHHGGSL
jgi:hypothetical protein